MSRRLLADERDLRLAEDSLFLIGETREALGAETRVLDYLDDEETQDRQDEADAFGEVEAAEKSARIARGKLTLIQERNGRKLIARNKLRSLFQQQSKTLDELEPTIARDAQDCGINILHPRLLEQQRPA